MQRIVGIVARVLVAASALALVILTASQDAEWWVPDPAVSFWIATSAAVIVFVDSSRSIYRAARRPTIEANRDKIHVIVRGCQSTLSTECDLDVEEFGGSVFVPRRRFFVGRRELRRVSRDRFTGFPPESDIRWGPGKGVIGSVWESSTAHHENRLQLIRDWAATDKSEHAFNALPKERTSGLSYHEFKIAIEKYSEIFAVPILNSKGALVGVFSIDIVYRANRAPEGPFLTGFNVEKIVVESAGFLRLVVE
jgi:hypothetical protein